MKDFQKITRQLKAGSRTYYFNIELDEENKPCLTFVEEKWQKAEKRILENTITVLEKDISDFIKKMGALMKAYKEPKTEKSPYRIQYTEFFSTHMRAGNRTYFFDLKETKNEKKYIVLTESKKKENSNAFQRNSIFIFKENVDPFIENLNEILGNLAQQATA